MLVVKGSGIVYMIPIVLVDPLLHNAADLPLRISVLYREGRRAKFCAVTEGQTFLRNRAAQIEHLLSV